MCGGYVRKALSVVMASLFCAVSLAQQLPARNFDGKSWWTHVKVLADDTMEGRETGSPGEKRAQVYVVEQMKQSGLEPAGTDGFYQPVKLVSRQTIEKESSLALVRNGKAQRLSFGDDAILSTRIEPAPEVNAPLVFVGNGLRIPAAGIDDFTGLDLKGKVVC